MSDAWWEIYQFLHADKKINGMSSVPPLCIFSREEWDMSSSMESFCQGYEETWGFDVLSAHPAVPADPRAQNTAQSWQLRAGVHCFISSKTGLKCKFCTEITEFWPQIQ